MEVFYRVVKAGSFVKAEKVMNKSQPTLSRSVSQLEDRLQARLLERTSRGLHLTRRGEQAFKIAQRMFMDMDSFRKSISEEDGMAGKIRISTTHAMASYILGPVLVDFAREYPEIEVELLGNDTDIDIFNNEVDLSIRPYSFREDDLIQEPLFTLEPGLYASHEYISSFGEPKSIKDLDDHRFLTFARAHANPYSDVEWALKAGRQGKENRVPFYTSNNVEHLIYACEKGLGIMSFYEEMIKNRKPKIVRIFESLRGPKTHQCLLFPKSLRNTEKIKKVTAFFQEKLGSS